MRRRRMQQVVRQTDSSSTNNKFTQTTSPVSHFTVDAHSLTSFRMRLEVSQCEKMFKNLIQL